ncbi:MAG: ATP-grasp domain-containing protein [Deltaproteobacteria bacterium]|nr:ATP-grasp domain-containing protein [Deltaproteobacteria bacterium]
MEQTSSLPQVGILGGGQLARMLLQEAKGLGIAPKVLTASAEDPAAHILADITLGALDDEAALRAFFSACDVITFESEFHLAERLAKAAEGLDARFVPSLHALAVMQDKLQQKALLTRIGVSSAPYDVFEGEGSDWRKWLGGCFEKLGEHLVLKWSRLGYDGKGTLFVDQPNLEAVPVFLDAAKTRGAEVYAEPRIDFVRELALVAVHSLDESFSCYPLVISEQEQGICKRVYGPAVAFGVKPTLHLRAEAYAKELFETLDGELLVNEMAPRVHNSGHYSLDAAECSQFENHLRAASGMALGLTQTAPAFAMLNLISDIPLPAPPLPQVQAPFVLHWYEKNEARLGRKMGHINVVAQSAEDLRERLREMDLLDQRWLKRLRQRTPPKKEET